MIYLSVILIILVLSFFSDFLGNKKYDNVYMVIIYIIIVCIAGFRYKLGGDTFNYMRDFESFPKLKEFDFFSLWGFKYSPLWILFFSLIKTTTDSFLIFQIVHALFINGVIIWFINKYTPFKYATILFYLFYYYLYFNTEILRESVSICLFLLAIPSYFKGKWTKYYLIIFVAILFHYSAVILLFFPFLKQKGIKLKKVLFFGVVLYLIPIILLEFLPPIIKIYYEEYVVYKSSIGGYIYSLQCFILFPMVILSIRKKVFTDYHPFELFSATFFVFGIYAFINPSIALRFFNYLIPITTLYFVDFSCNILTRAKVSKLYLIIIIPCILNYKTKEYVADTSDLLSGTKFYLRWYPYTNYFEKDSDKQRIIISRRERWAENHYSDMVENLKEMQ